MSLLQPKQSNGGFPPNGWPFTDPKTGFKCNGWEGTPQMHAVKIIQHRRANPGVYPPGESQWFDAAAVIQEIYKQKASTHPHLFRGYPDGPRMVTREQKGSIVVSPTLICGCGSNEWEELYCKTCAGRRITGYKCRKCGKERGK
jgi:hypothetical protein